MLTDKVLKIIKSYKLLSSLDKVLIGVSGGPDSLALLYILNALKVRLGIKIAVAHFNHGLRAKASDLDQRFVEDASRRMGLVCVSKKMAAKRKSASEEELRRERFNFLFETAKKLRIKKIALAHTLDDQAETVLMRLIRGSGLYGLVSMLPEREINSVFIIRPLLEISREEILSYLNKIEVSPRMDKSNFNRDFLRNRIRHKILKDLSQINPNIKQTLARFAKQAGIDYDYLTKAVSPYIKMKSSSLAQVNLERFQNLHLSLKRMVIRIALEKITGSLRTFTDKHWQEVQDLIGSRPSGSIVDLTRGMRIKKQGKNILIYADK